MVTREESMLVLCLFFLLLNPTFQQPTGPLTSPGERAALLQLRSSLGLRAREWPLKGDPCLVWVGIECRNGSVVGINISGFRRTRIGSLNPQFSVDSIVNLTSLSSFNASRFSLPGAIPDRLGLQVHALQVLDLRACSIFGAIPATLGNLTNLVALYLSDNNITGTLPFSLGQLSQLSVLDLAQNSITGSVPSSLFALSNLSRLDLSSNFLSGTIASDVGSLARLQFLNLSNNSLSSSVPAQLGNLSGLVNLDLSLNFFSGSLPLELGNLRNLQRMAIGSNLFSGQLPGSLFSHLTQLQYVVLSLNNFTGDFPNVLWTMPSLRVLDASFNHFTGQMPNRSVIASTTALVFNLSHNILYGGLTITIRRFSFVNLSGNYFEGVVPEFALANASMNQNCLQNFPSQKSQAECASFYGSRGLQFDNFGNVAEPPSIPSHKKSNRRVIILAAVLGGVGLIILVLIILLLLILCVRRRGTANQRGNGVGPIPTASITSPAAPGLSFNLSNLGEGFTYQQILLATNDFSETNLVKNGHSGDLYRGMLEGGVLVIIKRIDVRSVKDKHMLELDFFSKVSHPRVIPLLGYCLENENEKFLIYKYMPNGDLLNAFYRKSDTEDDGLQSLDWIKRLKVAIGAAEGLSYLHLECTPPLVHRDVQASSILLDDKFEVRLGSLSEVCAQEGESHSKRITKFLRFPQTSEQGASGASTATCAYDVYCFGKVLLELVTGKLGISASNDGTTKETLESMLPYISIYDKELVTNIVDPSLIIYEDLLEEVWAVAIVARSCLNPKASRRPLMRYVLKALENPLKVVREENTGSSARLRTTSSRGSWNAALFGSWRQSLSDVAAVPAGPTNRGEGGGSSVKQSATTGSQGSGQNGGGDLSSSTRRQSREIFPEPLDEHDVEREDE